jgi:hypothetical protein
MSRSASWLDDLSVRNRKQGGTPIAAVGGQRIGANVLPFTSGNGATFAEGPDEA